MNVNQKTNTKEYSLCKVGGLTTSAINDEALQL